MSLDDDLLNFKSKPETLGNGWKTVPLSAEKAATHLAHVKNIAEIKMKNQGEKRPVSTIQSASTARLLAMNADELALYRERKIDKDKAQVWKDADTANAAIKNAEEKIADNYSAQVITDYKRDAKQIKNDIGSAWSEGKSPVTEWMNGHKDSAVDAFMDTKAQLRPIEKAMINTADSEVFKGIEISDKTKRSITDIFRDVMVWGLGIARVKDGEIDRVRWQDVMREEEKNK